MSALRCPELGHLGLFGSELRVRSSGPAFPGFLFSDLISVAIIGIYSKQYGFFIMVT